MPKCNAIIHSLFNRKNKKYLFSKLLNIISYPIGDFPFLSFLGSWKSNNNKNKLSSSIAHVKVLLQIYLLSVNLCLSENTLFSIFHNYQLDAMTKTHGFLVGGPVLTWRYLHGVTYVFNCMFGEKFAKIVLFIRSLLRLKV